MLNVPDRVANRAAPTCIPLMHIRYHRPIANGVAPYRADGQRRQGRRNDCRPPDSQDEMFADAAVGVASVAAEMPEAVAFHADSTTAVAEYHHRPETDDARWRWHRRPSAAH